MGLYEILDLLLIVSVFFFNIVNSCSDADGTCQILEECSSNGDCGTGMHCLSCPVGLSGPKCVRSKATDQFKLLNNSLPFNKYAFLTTHNAFANDGFPNIAPKNQEDNVTQQLKNGVRGLMLDVYDFRGEVWLCHSFRGNCYFSTAFEPAVKTLKEIEAFLSANPSEIITIILEDYVSTPKGLNKIFTDAGLMKYWFPVSKMPKNGGDWPLVSDMVAKNQRLLVFTSVKSKEQSEGIAYQWNYMVENQYGDGGMEKGKCPKRAESSALTDTSKSLVLVNFFKSLPLKQTACVQNSGALIDMVATCHAAAGNRWANFLAVDFYKRSEGGGTFEAVDKLNGKLLCGKDDVHFCVVSHV